MEEYFNGPIDAESIADNVENLRKLIWSNMSKSEEARQPLLHLYVDETGSRHPDRPSVLAKHGNDWFAIGGILINQEDVETAKGQLADFTKQWSISAPLHFTDMRSEKKKFAWIGKLSDDERTKFWSSYRGFLASVPAAGTACVIDRPGYVARGYGNRNGDQKWLLCRSADLPLNFHPATFRASAVCTPCGVG